jgi:uncharacterized protein YyaL (SSP411 family)
VIFGTRGHPQTQELLRAVWGKAIPSRLVLVVEPGESLPEGHPAAQGSMQNGAATAYIAQGTFCSQPITSPAQLGQFLTLPRGSAPAA